MRSGFRQPGRDACFTEHHALEPADQGGMVRLFGLRSEEAQRDGRGRWHLSRYITIEQARSQYDYEGVDSSG